MPVYTFINTELQRKSAHDGLGHVNAATVRERIANSQINFLDIVVLPQGNSIGLHRHAANDEEIYVIVSGTGLMNIDGSEVRVAEGDVIVNLPGGIHGLIADGNTDIRMVVIDVSTDGSSYVTPVNINHSAI